MAKRLFKGRRKLRADLVLAALVLCALSPALAQRHGGGSALDRSDPARGHALTDRLPDKPSQPPAFAVPVEPLGFSAPGPNYLGERTSLVSLDFLAEDRLLFTFRVPGLIRRAADEAEVRQIRALVLDLPAGTVQAEALWTVHDRDRYLWALKDGHFLVRDQNHIELGDATLELKPYLRFPGPLLYLEMDPSQQLLVTSSREPEPKTEKPADAPSPASQPGFLVRILRRDSGQVMLVSRSSTAVHLPVNADGYLERLRGRGDKWLLNLNSFSGGSAIVGQLTSTCSPLFDFVSQREVLATTCGDAGQGKLVAMTTDGRRLWEYQFAGVTTMPQLVMAPDGLRLARETLAVTHAIDAQTPLDREDVKGQLVTVLDAADGKVALAAPAVPPLDAGGNVAISPSGRRVAVLNGGQIQVFELPSAPPLPAPAIPAPAAPPPAH
jgi:hypothetical protein